MPNVIWLDWPRKDFEATGLYIGTEGYFCSNQEYARHVSLSISGKALHKEVLRDGVYLQNFRTYEKKYRFQPVPTCPKSFPWILNAVHIQIQGCLLRIRWGPNYAEALQGTYVDVSLGQGGIWMN